MTMNKTIKKQWVKALRSGKYEQTEGCLKDKNGYCCLGVLCDILPKPAKKGISYFGTGNSVLNKRAMELTGLTSEDPRIGEKDASEWNDTEGKSFAEIADLIEAHL